MAGLEPTRRFTGYYLFSRQVPYAIRVTSPNIRYKNNYIATMPSQELNHLSCGLEPRFKLLIAPAIQTYTLRRALESNQTRGLPERNA